MIDEYSYELFSLLLFTLRILTYSIICLVCMNFSLSIYCTEHSILSSCSCLSLSSSSSSSGESWSYSYDYYSHGKGEGKGKGKGKGEDNGKGKGK